MRENKNWISNAIFDFQIWKSYESNYHVGANEIVVFVMKSSLMLMITFL
jgi:hypothetical protein